jgi:pimeloyl-ACP methyl ester carboxylesterase
MNDAKAAWFLRRLSPHDLGLPYESLSFSIRDAATGHPLQIAAWWIGHPQAQGRCALLLHGYADAKVGAIAWAPTFHALGFNLLAVDLRAHGQSQGRYSTGGFLERHDIDQVINQLRAQQGDAVRRLVLFGVSLGAAVACATAILRAEQNPPGDIDALVLECPFADYAQAIRSHARVLALPGDRLVSAAVWLAQKMSGADFDAVRPVKLISRVPCAVMVIRSDADLIIPPADADQIDAALAARPAAFAPGVYWQAQNAHHIAALCEDPELYRQKLAQFLETALSQNITRTT